jgi:hypothetical protein
MPDNPFELLRLPPSATEEEVVRQGARLCQRAPDEPARNLLRQAVRQLTGSAEERLLHALLTHPRPQHASADLERLQATFRRPPASTGAPPPIPPLDLPEVEGLLREILAAELEPLPLPLEAVPEDDPPEEIARQTAEALWQSLLSDMRA